MSPALAVFLALCTYALFYRFYARHLADRVFHLDDSRVTPAHTLNDGVDYVPTKAPVLFGHHYASITGLAPMLGPAVAVIWGWLPALIWVVLGACLIGAVHDFSALVISIRAQGRSVGDVAHGVIGPRARTLFHLIIFFGVSLAMGVFVFVIAKLFQVGMYPSAVLPSGLLMVVAMISGFLMYKKGVPLLPVAIVGFILELGFIWLGKEYPTMGLAPEAWPESGTWTWILLAYAFIASVLPVWSLLQARDFLNSLLLYLGLGLAYLGIFVARPAFVAPAVVMNPEGAPPIFPFVFIVIACGAASGFHGLVSSGTTAKQLDKERQALPIGYGGMIGESLLGLLAVIACTAGFASEELWHTHYASWNAAGGLPAKIGAFIQGTTSFLTALGIPESLASALIAMVVVSFALTTLDSATRLLRFNIEEIADSWSIPFLQNRYLSSSLACAAIGWFAFYEIGGKPAALALWGLFGTTNQLLAGLTLGLATLYLWQRDWPIWYTLVPAVFMMGSTLIAMVGNLRSFSSGPKADPLLFAVGGLLLVMGLWLLVEAGLAVRARKRMSTPDIQL